MPCPEEPAPCTHTVAQGDTVEMIAEQYGVNATAILDLNPGLVPELLEVGEVGAGRGRWGAKGTLPGPASWRVLL